MGNQPSAPQTPTSTPTPTPQPAPVCDSECQKQKKIAGLKTTLDQKAETRDSDPNGYEQARIAYYTAVNGPGWLQKEKDRIAKKEIEPSISAYVNRYNELTKQNESNKTFVSMANAIKYQEATDEEETNFLNKQFQKLKDKQLVLDRLQVLNQPVIKPYTIYSGWTTLVYILIAILVIYIGYKIFTKPKTAPAPVSAGKRTS